MDTQHRLIEYAEMVRGTIDGASVYPRELVKEALRLNAAAVIIISLLREPSPIERLQANLFTGPEANAAGPAFKLWRSSVNVDDLRTTVVRYLGDERTARAFHSFEQQRGSAFVPGQEADAHTIRFAEQLLASAIGAASSRLVLSLMLRRRNVSTEAALKLLDDASAAIQYSRTLLQPCGCPSGRWSHAGWCCGGWCWSVDGSPRAKR